MISTLKKNLIIDLTFFLFSYLIPGYGHIYPLTLTGKLFTIIYALMALGGFFAILANIGSALANGLTYVYSRICCRCFRIQRVKSEIPSRVMRKKLRRRLVDEEIGEEAFMPTSSIPIPIGKKILRIRPKDIGLVHTHQESLQD